MKPTSSTTGTPDPHAIKLSQGLHVRVLSDPEEIARFDELLRQKHYLKESVRVGDFMRQVVERDSIWVGLLVWGPAAFKLKDREKWLGWNSAMAAERLKLVVQNRRFLLLKDRGEEPNLASAVLAAACRHLPSQWKQLFEYEPLIAESFTDPEAFKGTCYKASGWMAAGMSAGSSRARPDFYVSNGSPKCLWLKELRPDAKSLLKAAPLAPEHARAVVDVTSGKMPLNASQRQSLADTLRRAKDPRSKNTRFRIGPLLTLVSMALLCGARQISEIARFATRLRPRQRRDLGLPLKKGTKAFYEAPSYSVFYQVLTRLDSVSFSTVLSEWLSSQQDTLPGALALDGKMIRDIIGTVSLVDVEDGTPVAVGVMEQKENTTRCELKAAQDLLAAVPSLEGKTVTADALHCQKNTARMILEKGGEYFLQIKGNQPHLNQMAQAGQQEAPFLPKPAAVTVGSRNGKSASKRRNL